MSRFFNKYEITNIMLIIILLGINSFTELSTEYISYEDKRNHIGLIIAMVFMLLNVYMYSTLIQFNWPPEILYKPISKNDVDNDSDNTIQIRNMSEKNDTNNTDISGIIISRKIVVGFIVTVILVIIATSITLGGNSLNSNPLKMRILLSLPLLALAGGVIGISVVT